MWKRGEIAPEEQFLLFSTLFYIYISNFRSQITYSFVKCGCSIYCFPHSLNSDMSKYGYLEVFQWVRDNGSRLCFSSTSQLYYVWIYVKLLDEWQTVHYENIPIQIYWKVNHRKIENFQTKNSNIFHISAQNIDCGYSLEPLRRGGSNEYPQSMFLSRNK